ncbi:hypothetical protein B0A48_18623 [Cryoendolithus antarcticus]|uniref:RGS domain-containing protein n=1 Tax=Cryoendolithus antarcticus TaxID=1507870 RepID=A0A1V8S7M2_9PEZI|nr:hypothetical protein B0A48_18623 [Cryoendolithus antarcticus]
MACKRLYRDYSIPEHDSFDTQDHHTHAMQKARTFDSRVTAILENGLDAEETDTKYTGAGIAQIADDATVSSTTDDESSPEPVLHQEQMDTTHFFADVAPAPMIPLHTDALSPSGESAFSLKGASASIVSHELPTSGLHSFSSKKLPEFFSQSTFQTVLNNPTISHQLLKFARSRLCGENLDFLIQVSRYRGQLEVVSKLVYEIHNEFISGSSETQINLTKTEHRKVSSDIRTALKMTLPSLESIFLHAQSRIEDLVYLDVYRKFVQYQMSISAAKALGQDQSRYAGLGDCFVLTDPSKADNPILFASDGFVKVSGYQRTEIIPRNCRFLQSQETDRQAVKRLKIAIDKREESVELLLNRKKNGEPFWNLLYTTPLFDEHGKLLFFLGGQINCSTTIHSASDVLCILAQSNESDKEDQTAAMTPSLHTAQSSRSRTILKSLPFRIGSRNSIQARAPGTEETLLKQISDKSLKEQMNSFYTAYSNWIVINYTSYLITFVSSGILDLLFPIKARTVQQAQAVGSEIFRFLANHGAGSVRSEFKAAVKSNLKMGQPISLDLKLCARPYMGFEKFVLHWTPLKNERGEVQWVVLTLGNEQRVGLPF